MGATRQCLRVLALLSLSDGIFCFTAPSQLSRSEKIQQSPHRCAAASRDARTQSCLSNEIFVVSFDGVVADTAEWRAMQGIRAALATWPHLQNLYDQDQDWLMNKMLALSHVMTNRPTLSSDCALLARLLMEEQELDEGRSIGKDGKYASRFHPSSSERQAKSQRQRNGSRPLTVGEIGVNWSEGGCLAETLLTRYNVNGKNPLPILQEYLTESSSHSNGDEAPRLNHVVCDALAACTGTVIVTVGHASDVPTVIATLEPTFLQPQVATSIQDTLYSGGATILSHDGQSELTMLQQLLLEAPGKSSIYVVNSSWKALQDAKVLFGDNIPRTGMGKAVFGTDIQLSLNLPNWAENTHLSQHNDAEMDPWTNLMAEEQFAEIVSARIVTRRRD